MLLKRSKTLQNRKETPELLLTQHWGAALCPVAAMKAMFNTNPLCSNDPLFSIRHAGRTTTLTDSMARKHVKLVGTKLHHPAHLTFHMFIKGGVSWAFQHGVPLQDIMLHGTWSSSAVRRYIKSLPTATSPGPSTFCAFLHLVWLFVASLSPKNSLKKYTFT